MLGKRVMARVRVILTLERVRAMVGARVGVRARARAMTSVRARAWARVMVRKPC